MKVDISGLRLLHTLETFIVIFVTTVFAQVALTGQTVDLSNDAGRAAFVSAIVSALYLAARRVISLGGSSNGPSGN